MEGKLIKRGKESYRLFVNDAPFAQIEESPYKKLSIKNCEEIEHGYDLFELAEKEAKKIHDWNKHKYSEVFYNKLVRKDAEFIKIGFKKALEILGDKKFSELDMRIAYDAGCNNIDADDNIDFQDTINSLQQTEWDVEIVIGTTNIRYDGGSYITANPKPKLDENGCLILKRI